VCRGNVPTGVCVVPPYTGRSDHERARPHRSRQGCHEGHGWRVHRCGSVRRSSLLECLACTIPLTCRNMVFTQVRMPRHWKSRSQRVENERVPLLSGQRRPRRKSLGSLSEITSRPLLSHRAFRCDHLGGFVGLLAATPVMHVVPVTMASCKVTKCMLLRQNAARHAQKSMLSPKSSSSKPSSSSDSSSAVCVVAFMMAATKIITILELPATMSSQDKHTVAPAARAIDTTYLGKGYQGGQKHAHRQHQG